MRQMIRYANGETRVIDVETMTASEFLGDNDQGADLEDYNLDCDLDGRDLDPNNSQFIVLR